MQVPVDQLAREAYAAYGRETGGTNFYGLPMPEWDQLGQRIQGAWTAAALAVAEQLLIRAPHTQTPEQAGTEASPAPA